MIKRFKAWLAKHKKKRKARIKARQERKTPIRVANLALICIFAHLVLLTIATLIIFCITGAEPTELIESNFTVIGLEAGGLILKRMLDKLIPVLNKDRTVESEDQEEIDDTEGDE